MEDWIERKVVLAVRLDQILFRLNSNATWSGPA